MKHIVIDDNLHEALKQSAKQNKMTLQEFTTTLLEDGVKNTVIEKKIRRKK